MSLSFRAGRRNCAHESPALATRSGTNRIDFRAVLGKTWPRIHAADSRVFTCTNCSFWADDCHEAEVVDTQLVARPGSLRRYTVVAGAGVCTGPGPLASAGHLSVRRGVWRNGASPAGHDPRVRRSRIIRALQMALHSCAAVSARDVRSLFLVGLERNFAG